MALKLNGVEITSNKLNSSDVTLENLDGVKVWPTETPTLKWQFVGSYSSDPDNYDLLCDWNINGDYEAGIAYLDENYPVDYYPEGSVAIILDETTDYYYEYVVVAV